MSPDINIDQSSLTNSFLKTLLNEDFKFGKDLEKLNLFTKHFLQTVIINVVLMRLTAPGLFKGFCCQKCKLLGIPMGLETFLNSLKIK